MRSILSPTTLWECCWCHLGSIPALHLGAIDKPRVKPKKCNQRDQYIQLLLSEDTMYICTMYICMLHKDSRGEGGCLVATWVWKISSNWKSESFTAGKNENKDSCYINYKYTQFTTKSWKAVLHHDTKRKNVQNIKKFWLSEYLNIWYEEVFYEDTQRSIPFLECGHLCCGRQRFAPGIDRSVLWGEIHLGSIGMKSHSTVYPIFMFS